MLFWQAVVLGIIQGASEFLPISSSGHLVIFQALLDVDAADIYLEVALHCGTLVAVLAYFRRDLVGVIRGTLRYVLTGDRGAYTEEFRLGVCLVLGTLPVAFGGLLLKGFFERTFESTTITGAMLLVTAAILLATRLIRVGDAAVDYKRAILIGLAQLAAILPGISRSGATISTAMFLGMDPARAARFSFLLSIPAVTAAFLVKLCDALEESVPGEALIAYALGAALAFLVGLVAIHYLLKLIAANRFFLFGFWCLPMGMVTLLFI